LFLRRRRERAPGASLERKMAGGEGTAAAAVTGEGEMRSLALTPTWSVATVLTLLVAGSLIIERSIHRLSNVSSQSRSRHVYKEMQSVLLMITCLLLLPLSCLIVCLSMCTS
jgi:hypothetical protein